MRFVEHIFPTVIHGAVLDEDLLVVQNEMAKVIDKIEWVSPEEWGQTHLLSTTDFNQNDIKNHNMVEFARVLDNEIRVYCEYIDFEYKPYTIKSWFNKFRTGDYGHVHTHGATDISGVYYFQSNGQDGDLMFMSPNGAAASSKLFGAMNQFWNYSPMTGKMLMFPGWLPHGIKRNTTTTDRISFAFNITFES